MKLFSLSQLVTPHAHKRMFVNGRSQLVAVSHSTISPLDSEHERLHVQKKSTYPLPPHLVPKFKAATKRRYENVCHPHLPVDEKRRCLCLREGELRPVWKAYVRWGRNPCCPDVQEILSKREHCPCRKLGREGFVEKRLCADADSQQGSRPHLSRERRPGGGSDHRRLLVLEAKRPGQATWTPEYRDSTRRQPRSYSYSPDASPKERHWRQRRPSNPGSTASTLVPPMADAVGDTRDRRYTESRYRHPEPRPPQQYWEEIPRNRAFQAIRGVRRPHHSYSTNPLIKSIIANPYQAKAHVALSQLETLASMVSPIMQDFNLRIDRLLEMEEDCSLGGINDGNGTIKIQVWREDGEWRDLDEMVYVMLGELAHCVYAGTGLAWSTLRNEMWRAYKQMKADR
jgi:WLM domain